MGGYLGKSVGGFTSVTEKRQTFNISTTTTQLTGLSYTPTKEEVHVNGIRYVRDVDYTANDGLTVTMTNPLLNGDTAIVSSFPSFDVADTVSASNGGTFAGNVQMSGNATVGGTLGVTGNSTLGGTLDVAGQLNTGNILPSADNASDLGSAAKRFNDLYVGGGIVFGDASAASVSSETLDDYEEGTFNLEMVGYHGSPSPKIQIPSHYTKIGNTVHFWSYKVSINSTGYSGNMWFDGLPFSAPSPYSVGTIYLSFVGTYSGYGPFTLISGNIVYGLLHQSNASSWSAIMHNVVTSGGEVYLYGTYKIA